MEHFLCFWCLEVLPVCLRREVKSFIIWFYPPWLDYDVSLHRVIELVVVIPTSPRSKKWSPDAQVIAIFVLVFLPVFGFLEP
jgi:hypothetical protein